MELDGCAKCGQPGPVRRGNGASSACLFRQSLWSLDRTFLTSSLCNQHSTALVHLHLETATACDTNRVTSAHADSDARGHWGPEVEHRNADPCPPRPHLASHISQPAVAVTRRLLRSTTCRLPGFRGSLHTSAGVWGLPSAFTASGMRCSTWGAKRKFRSYRY